jgi:glutamate 5-kinase
VRTELSSARRIVVKLGSRALSSSDELIDGVAKQVAELRHVGTRELLIVSSGAIAFGCRLLGYETRPTQMPRLQAAAAAGQSALMRRYSEAFTPHKMPVAQVLLTHSDLASRRRLLNAQNALEALFEAGAVPIVNENDTVSTDEIRFGDNDQLASMVAPLVRADLLLLLTDVAGVLNAEGEIIPAMQAGAELTIRKAEPGTVGTGGMASKVFAAEKAARAGAHVVIARATEPNVITRIVSGEVLGTHFQPANNALRARQHWIAYTLKPRGDIFINEGAVRALKEHNASLLPVGVVSVAGQFSRGDAVRVLGPNGEVARGLARLGLAEVARAAGKSSQDLHSSVGELETMVVHRDDLVLVD